MFSSIIAVALAVSLLAQLEPAPLTPTGSVSAGAPAVPGDELRHVGATPPPHGYPRIQAIALSATDIHPGSRVHGSVETSGNVGYVEARIENYNLALHEDAPGRFSLQYTVPWWLPPWLRHPYTLQIIARSIDGVELVRPIAIRVH
jgi:hypothetical protein